MRSDERKRQHLILDLTRERQGYLQQIEEKESDEDRPLPLASYERGIAYGLSLALNRIEQEGPNQ